MSKEGDSMMKAQRRAKKRVVVAPPFKRKVTKLDAVLADRGLLKK